MATRRAVILGGLGLAAAGAGAGVWRFRSDLAAAEAGADPARSRLVPTRHGPLEVAEAGEGPPVPCSISTGGGFDQALAMGGPLVGHGFRLIGPSRFGYLRTPMPPDASPAAEADAMADLLDALGLDRVAVVGGSAGAIPALAFALGHPDRCAALVALVPALPAPGLPPPEPWSPAQERLAHRVLGSDLLFWAALRLAPDLMTETLLATDRAVVAAASPAEQARVRAIREAILPVSRRRDGLLMDARATTTPTSLELAAIRAPTLAVSCEDDRFGTAAAARVIAEAVPGAALIVYPDGGHVWVGRNDQLFADIAGFLRRAP